MRESLVPALIVGLFASMLLYAVVVYRFLRYLKKNHRLIWIELGSPAFLLNTSIQNSWLTSRFLLGRKYETIGDATGVRMGRQARATYILTMVLFAACFITVFFLPKH